MEFLSVLEPQCCTGSLEARNKSQAIRELALLAARSDRIGLLTPDAIETCLQAREAEGSTAYGGCIAIPHARIEGLEEFVVVVAVAPRGIDFEAVDGKRVRLFTLILGPTNQPGEYLKLLATVSRLLGNVSFRKEILQAHTAQAVHESCARWSRGEHRAATTGAQVLLTVVLYEQHLLNELLSYYVEMGVEGATILQSQGMNEYISEVPLYAEMIQFMHTRKSQSKTILAIVPEPDVDDLMAGVERIIGNLDQVQGAVIYAQPLLRVRGTMRMLD